MPGPNGGSLAPSVTENEDRPKASWIWMKDTGGQASVTVTFVTIAFWVTTLLYVASAFEQLGPIHLRPFDVAACGAYFAPLLALYWGIKHTDAKFGITAPNPVSVVQNVVQVPGVNPRQTDGGDAQ